jgi:predicted transcriptional regulator
MTETSRVQRWREAKRRHGLKAVTIWLTTDEELRLKDLALAWHCSPSAVMQRALAQVTTRTPAQNGSPPDTPLIRELIRVELAAMQAAQAPVTDTVTEVVTATLARDLPPLVRQLVEGLAREALGLPVTDTNSNVADTEIPTQEPEPRKVGRPRGEMGQRIVALLREHPEGLSAEQIRAFLQPEKPLGDTLQSLRTREKVRTQGKGRGLRYFVA